MAVVVVVVVVVVGVTGPDGHRVGEGDRRRAWPGPDPERPTRIVVQAPARLITPTTTTTTTTATTIDLIPG